MKSAKDAATDAMINKLKSTSVALGYIRQQNGSQARGPGSQDARAMNDSTSKMFSYVQKRDFESNVMPKQSALVAQARSIATNIAFAIMGICED